MDRTLLLVKPNVVRIHKIGAVLDALEEKGLVIRDMRMLTLTRERAETFYAIHRGKSFYDRLVTFMTSGPIVAVILEHENCVEYVRSVIGNTDPEKAAKGTIRKLYGLSITENAVHASDSNENAEKEISIMFGRQSEKKQ
ncbi:nucleoside-diphosphate kinase [bacterium]|nr:nucleoside-diphosphate kinase [bacterium]